MEVEFPASLDFLISEPARYKILYGGRGAGKSEGISIALIILATQKKLRILCLRELQTSIEESVKETITNNIHAMDLDDEFLIQDKRIVSKRTGSEFIFSGLRYNINKIKSLARIDIAWVEEAVNVSKASWDKLGPTIRGRHKDDPMGMGGPFNKGPEIIVSFNPELDTDETYSRFVLKRDKYAPDYALNEDTGKMERYAIVRKVNWTDNKWFPSDQRQEMNVLKAADETAWLEVWEGHTKQTLDGAIFAKEIKQVLLDGRRGKVPYDSSRPVHTFWDLGHSDHTAIWFVQQVGMEYNIINYYQDHLQKIGFYLEYLQAQKYMYGKHYLPHDADNETLASRSIAKIVREAYPNNVKIVPRVAKKVLGINASRTIFDLCNFDEELTSDGWQCLCRYQYDVDAETGQFSREPSHNEYSHGADAFQTFALSLKSETATKKHVTPSTNVIPMRNANNWMS
jgi:phage terminase large subunit